MIGILHALFLLIASHPAHAIIGTAATSQQPELPLASVCRVFLLDQKFEPNSICTGVLIAPDQVMTAGHCVREVGEAAHIEVVRGYLGFDADRRREFRSVSYGEPIVTEGAGFAEPQRRARSVSLDHGESRQGHANDVAVIFLAWAGLDYGRLVPVEPISKIR